MLPPVVAGVLVAVLLSWWLLSRHFFGSEPERPANPNFFGSVVAEQDMSAFQGDGPGYRWTQTVEEVEIVVPAGPSTRAKDVRCHITSASIECVCCGTEVLKV